MVNDAYIMMVNDGCIMMVNDGRINSLGFLGSLVNAKQRVIGWWVLVIVFGCVGRFLSGVVAHF